MSELELPRKIILCGVSGAGKSTLGDTMAARFHYVPIGFADPLKEACGIIFGFDEDDLYGPSHRRNARYNDFEFSGWCFECNHQCRGPARHLRARNVPEPEQSIALELKHAEDEDYWLCPICHATYPKHVTVREALKTLGTAWGRKFCTNLWAATCLREMRAKPDSGWIVTDCRFPNERNRCALDGCFTVLLLRELEASSSPHPSEAEVRAMAKDPSGFDGVLDNREGGANQNFEKLIALLQRGPQSRPRTAVEWITPNARPWR